MSCTTNFGLLHIVGLLVDFLGKEDTVNERNNATLRDGNTGEKFVQFIVIANGQLKVSWTDAGFAIVRGSITSQFENFSDQILDSGGQIDGSTDADAGSIVALLQDTENTTDGKLQTGTDRFTDTLGALLLASLAMAGHVESTVGELVGVKYFAL